MEKVQKVHRLNPDMEASSPETLDKIEKFSQCLDKIECNALAKSSSHKKKYVQYVQLSKDFVLRSK